MEFLLSHLLFFSGVLLGNIFVSVDYRIGTLEHGLLLELKRLLLLHILLLSGVLLWNMPVDYRIGT
jgi:hypothetical protein